MKRNLNILLSLFVLASMVLAACGSAATTAPAPELPVATETLNSTELLVEIAETWQADLSPSPEPTTTEEAPDIILIAGLESEYGVFPLIQGNSGTIRYFVISSTVIRRYEFEGSKVIGEDFAINKIFGEVTVEFSFGLSCPLWIGSQRLWSDESVKYGHCVYQNVSIP